MGELVRDALRVIVSSGSFLVTPLVTKPLLSPSAGSEQRVKLEWGKLNRVRLSFSGVQFVQLPQIEANWVSHPLLIDQTQSATGASMDLVGAGVNVRNESPLVNGFATGVRATGFRTAITDGSDWTVY
jgi:hypothetical protein